MSTVLRSARFALASAAALLLLQPGSALAASAFDKGFDAVILRPTSFAVLLTGAGLFIPAAIVTSPGGRDAIARAYDVFISRPAEEVLDRPLGEF